MNSLLKSSIFSIAGSVVQLVISVFSGIIIARVLGPEGKGQVFLVIQFASLGSLCLSCGLGASYLYHLKIGILKQGEAVSHALSLLFLLFLSFIVMCEYTMPWLRKITSYNLSDKIIILLLGLVLINIAILLFGSILMAQAKGVQLSSVFGIISGILYLILLLVFVVWLKFGPFGAVLSVVISYFLRWIMISLPLGNIFRHLTIKSIKLTKPLLIYGVGSFASNLMMTSVFRVDTFIVNSMASSASLGIYSIAVNLAELLLVIPSAVGTALFPHLTSQKNENRLETACLVARLNVGLALVFSMGMLLFGYPIILLLFGAKFLSAYIPMLCLFPGLIAMTASYSYCNYFSSCGQPAKTAWISGVGVIINIVLNLILIPLYGIIGAAIVSSISYIMVVIIIIAVIRNAANLPWSSFIIPTKNDFSIIINRLNALRMGREIL